MVKPSAKPRIETPEDLRSRLAEEAALFSFAYKRWTESKCEGMTYLRARALEALECQGPSMMRSVGEYLGLSPRNMTALVDSLEDDGLVVRGAHPDDRRATLIELTPQGKSIAADTFQRRVGIIGELFGDLSTKQQESLLESLSILRAGLRSRGMRA